MAVCDPKDVISIGTIDMSTITNGGSSWVTGSVTTPSTYTIGPTGTTAYTISTGAGAGAYSSNYSYSTSPVNITGSGITMPSTADIKIGDKSLSEFMTKMEERLAILVPDPSKLEKFEALKKAYDHYKLMEKLCQEENKEDK